MSTRDDVRRLEHEFAEATQRLYAVGNGLARLRTDLDRAAAAQALPAATPHPPTSPSAPTRRPAGAVATPRGSPPSSPAVPDGCSRASSARSRPRPCRHSGTRVMSRSLAHGPHADLALRCGLGLAAVAVAKLSLFDLAALSGMVRSVAFIAAGLLLIATGSRYARAQESEGRAH